MLKFLRYAVFLLLGVPLTAHAAQQYGSAAEEAKMLPDYCQNPEQWKSILGPAAGWNNHTCYGINWINRYYKGKNSREKQNALQSALGDFNYSISKLPPDFPLMPEIYMYRGITYTLMGRNGEAVADLHKAISMDPKLTRAYNELADLYETKSSQPGKALEIITEGLRHNPETKSMQRRYTRLGGKLPYPEPLSGSAPVAADTPASSEQNAISTAAPITAPVGKAEAKPEVEAPKIGTPENPYCRFCPD